ncbi:hypothetical protein [Microvirga terricola]|uniref:Secreted protein n=1 Tax=Microvirga terricola TaxID=2719797 RepID=A0ABX0VCS9_9HYPH|nr:hypothetical protein [Microvirga terricola]NIX76969.1 hypothetical protein [Microvirga terricola]
MRRAYAMLGLGAVVLVAAGSLTLMPEGGKASATEATFLVPAADGYGVAECLVSGHTCGKAVADTWCEAQGYSRAVSFRQADPEDVTGSVEVQKVATAPAPRPVAITCSN